MPIPIPLIIGGIQAGAQFFKARNQRKKAKDLQESTFVPPALEEATNSARAQANSTRYAGQDQDESNIRQNTADTFANVSKSTNSTGTLLNAASRLNSQQGQQYSDVARRGVQFRQSAQDVYRQMLGQKANVQQGNRNKFEATKSALLGAAGQNEYNALNSVLGGAAITDFNNTGMGNQFAQSDPYSQVNASNRRFGRKIGGQLGRMLQKPWNGTNY